MLSHQAAAASLACAPPRNATASRPSLARAAQRLPHPPCPFPAPAQLRSRASLTTARNAKGDGPVGAWLDLAALVSSSSKAPGMSEFATEIGRDIYVDIAGWHLVRQARPLLLGAALCALGAILVAAPKELARLSPPGTDDCIRAQYLRDLKMEARCCAVLGTQLLLNLTVLSYPRRLAWRTQSPCKLLAAAGRSARPT